MASGGSVNDDGVRTGEHTSTSVEGTEHGEHLGVLRFDFPGYGGEDLEHVSWDSWLDTFDQRELNFIYQEERKDGQPRNFFKLESPHREDAWAQQPTRGSALVLILAGFGARLARVADIIARHSAHERIVASRAGRHGVIPPVVVAATAGRSGARALRFPLYSRV